MRSIECDTISDIIITHWHGDHTGGLQQLIKLFPDVRVSKYNINLRGLAPDTLQYNSIHATNNINTTQSIHTTGATLYPLYTPGHTSDHICLYLKEQNILFCGDTVLGNSTAIFSSLKPYMNSLQLIHSLQPDILYSAHGDVISDGVKRIDMYINHRMQRESQILNTINHSNHKLKPIEIVHEIYIDLDDRLIAAATNNVVLHLEKLVLDEQILYESNNNTVITDTIDDADTNNESSEESGKQRILERSEWLWYSKKLHTISKSAL